MFFFLLEVLCILRWMKIKFQHSLVNWTRDRLKRRDFVIVFYCFLHFANHTSHESNLFDLICMLVTSALNYYFFAYFIPHNDANHSPTSRQKSMRVSFPSDDSFSYLSNWDHSYKTLSCVVDYDYIASRTFCTSIFRSNYSVRSRILLKLHAFHLTLYW